MALISTDLILNILEEGDTKILDDEEIENEKKKIKKKFNDAISGASIQGV